MKAKSRRNLIILTAALVLLALTLAACGEQPAQTAETSEAVTEAPTKSPYIDTDVNTPEWTPIAIPIYLKDNYYIYAQNEDFLCFAFVGTDEDNAELQFMLNDTTAKMLSEQEPGIRYYISIGEDETHIGDVTLSDDFKTATLKCKGQHDFEAMTKIASRIRGLTEE